MHKAEQEYSYTWALDSAVKQQLQAEVDTSRLLTATACNLIRPLDVLELWRLFLKPGKLSQYQDMTSIVWNENVQLLN